MQVGHAIDVIGAILDVGPPSMITLKDGNQRQKKTIMLADDGNLSISITIWGENCDLKGLDVGKIVALKSCGVSDYGGKSLNASFD